MDEQIRLYVSACIGCMVLIVLDRMVEGTIPSIFSLSVVVGWMCMGVLVLGVVQYMGSWVEYVVCLALVLGLILGTVQTIYPDVLVYPELS
jgi:hypothetical protein